MKSFYQFLQEVSNTNFVGGVGDISHLNTKESDNITKLLSAASKVADKSPARLLSMLRQINDDEVQAILDEIDPSSLRSGMRKIGSETDSVVPSSSDMEG